MKYYVNFQHMPKGHSRPIDNGDTVPITMDERTFGLLPNIGDYVNIDIMGRATKFSGIVKSRLFTFLTTDTCGINIVVADVNDSEFAKLIKE